MPAAPGSLLAPPWVSVIRELYFAAVGTSIPVLLMMLPSTGPWLFNDKGADDAVAPLLVLLPSTAG